MRVLTDAELDEVVAEQIPSGVPVRFMGDGRVYCIDTGESTKGGNVIHQVHYWGFTKETSKKIAKWSGLKAVFSK